MSQKSKVVDYDQMNDELNEEVTVIRAQIEELTKRRQLVSSTLLSSSKIHSKLNKQTNNSILQNDNPLLSSSEKHAQSNLHRLTFSATAFPFADPSPRISNRRLLGIRIDVCGRTGKFDKPYYLLLKKVDGQKDTSSITEDALRIHRHTIPAFIPLRKYEDQYLPLQDEGYASELSKEGTNSNRQNLHMLVGKLRHELVSWTLRREAIDHLREKLAVNAVSNDDSEGPPTDKVSGEIGGRYGINSVTATAVEARYASLEWQDGRVGRIRISDKGTIERAVIFGDGGRLKNTERLLVGQNVEVEDFRTRLEILASRGI